jgi:threonine dehydrogenase-like Zn-dependent dehydrogenase
MQAAIMQNGAIEVGEFPDPEPRAGEVLVRTLACGLCASDLHLLHHGRKLVEWSRAEGGPFDIDLDRPAVMGHEYCAEIVDYGPGTARSLPIGALVTSTPIVIGPDSMACVGISNDYPGGFGEYMVLSEALVRPVPESLGVHLAALTEPVSVGTYYMKAARLEPEDVPLVIGCGAIGLAVVAALRSVGARPVVAADFSAARREMALRMGADVVIDPTDASPYERVSAASSQPTVIFECVGVPGVLDEVMRGAARGTRIMVAGWCLETDHVFTPVAHTKGLTVKFGGGPGLDDFDTALRALGDGTVDVSAWITAEVGLSGVADSLEAMRDPASGIRTIVDPRRA